MPFGEVAGDELPALDAEHERAAHVEQRSRRPRCALRGRRRERRRRRAARHRSAVLPARPSTEWRRSGSSRLASRKSAMWPTRTTPYARRTASAESSKASGHAERHDEQRGHGAEDREPHRALLGVDDAREPGVAAPTPTRGPRGRAAPAPTPPQVGSRAISAVHCVKREHEHEVEEELERRDALLLAQDRREPPGACRALGRGPDCRTGLALSARRRNPAFRAGSRRP